MSSLVKIYSVVPVETNTNSLHIKWRRKIMTAAYKLTARPIPTK